MRRHDLLLRPKTEVINRARAQLALRKFLRNVKKADATNISFNQQNQLINKLRFTGNDNNTRTVKIFQCCHCLLWHEASDLRNRTHWDLTIGQLELFRVCRSCKWVLIKMNVELRYFDLETPSN